MGAHTGFWKWYGLSWLMKWNVFSYLKTLKCPSSHIQMPAWFDWSLMANLSLYSFFFYIFLLLFNYSCLHFHPPHPLLSPALLPIQPSSLLSLSMGPLYLSLDLTLPFQFLFCKDSHMLELLLLMISTSSCTYYPRSYSSSLIFSSHSLEEMLVSFNTHPNGQASYFLIISWQKFQIDCFFIRVPMMYCFVIKTQFHYTNSEWPLRIFSLDVYCTSAMQIPVGGWRE